MREALYTTRFERDVRLAQKRGKDIGKLKRAIALLLSELPLPDALQDHPLRGSWAGHRDLHIEPDWVLIYAIAGKTVQLEHTGTHADLFR